MYAVIYTEQVFNPSDGHGYPSYYSEREAFKKFKDDEEMKAWLLSNNKPLKYQLIEYRNIEVALTTSVSIK